MLMKSSQWPISNVVETDDAAVDAADGDD